MKGPFRVREETCWRHYMSYSFRLAARVLLYAPFHKQNSTYHGLCYTSRGTLAGTTNRTMSEHCYHGATSRTGIQGRKIFLFHDVLDTFYLHLYGIRNMVTDHRDYERGNLLPLHELFFSISSWGVIIPQTG